RGVAVLHRLEKVPGDDERVARRPRQLGGDPLAEAGWRVDAGPERRATNRKLGEMRERGPHARDAVADDARVAAELLTEGHRYRILEVRPAGLDHVGEGPRAILERGGELLEGGQEIADDRAVGRDVDRGREDVVRALPHVHVVVRVDDRLLAALRAEVLEGAIGDHLVRIHVRRRPGAGLEDVDDELAVEAAV